MNLYVLLETVKPRFELDVLGEVRQPRNKADYFVELEIETPDIHPDTVERLDGRVCGAWDKTVLTSSGANRMGHFVGRWCYK